MDLTSSVVKGCVTFRCRRSKRKTSGEVVADMQREGVLTHSDCADSPFTQLMQRVYDVLEDDVRHGHFRVVISGEIGNGKKRSVTIEAGKMDRFVIAEEDVA